MEIPTYIYIISPLLNAVIFLVGLLGNICVLIVVIKIRNMRTPTNVFLLNLSVADILVLLFSQPAGLLEFFGKDRWFLGKAMCKLVPLMENGALHVSILTMLAVTCERYQAICHPFKRRMGSTIPATLKTILVIWIIGLTLGVPILIMTGYEDALFYDGSPIKVCRTKVDEMWRQCYTIFIFIAFFVVPLFILIALYTCIIRQLVSDKLKFLVNNDRGAIKTLKSRRQVVRMLIFIIVLFFVSLLPIRAFSLWLVFAPTSDLIKLGLEAYLNLITWARLLMYINSAGNPLIYSLTSTKFKKAFEILIKPRRNVHSTDVTSNRHLIQRVHNNRHELQDMRQSCDKDDSQENRKPLLVVRLVFKPDTEHRRLTGYSQGSFPLQLKCANIQWDDKETSLSDKQNSD